MLNGAYDNMPVNPVFFDGEIGIIASSYLTKKLSKRKYLVDLDSREILVSPGEKIDSCYLIKDGLLISYEMVGGHRRIYDYFEKDMFVLEEYALLNQPSHLFYEALTPLKMYSIQIEFVKKLLENDKRFATACFAQMTRNYMVMQDLLRKSVAHTARWQVCDLLILFANKTGVVKNGDTVLNLHITKTFMSNLLHMNRITIMRELQLLEGMELCKLKGTQCTIRDLDALKRYRDSIE